MCCRNECAYISIILGIVSGVALGVLYALGFVATGIIFWVYLAVGLAGILLLPFYVSLNVGYENKNCGCNYKNLIIIGSVGAIITAAVGLIIELIAPTIAVAIVLGLATFFVAFLLVTAICVTNCLCNRNQCNMR